MDKKKLYIIMLVMFFSMMLVAVLTTEMFAGETEADSSQQHNAEKSAGGNSAWGFIAAALATGFSTIGAGYAVGHVGAAAMSAMSENPEMAGRALIFVGLAEGIAIYGLIIAIMILGRV